MEWFKNLPVWLQALLIGMAIATGLTIIQLIVRWNRFGLGNALKSTATGDLAEVSPEKAVAYYLNKIGTEKDPVKQAIMINTFKAAVAKVELKATEPTPSTPPANQEAIVKAAVEKALAEKAAADTAVDKTNDQRERVAA